MDPGIQWSEAEGNPYQPSGVAWVGPQALVDNLFMKLATEWENFSLHPATFYEAGDSAVVEGRYTGKYLPTGAELDSQYCHVFTFAGDKLVRFQQYTDTAQYQRSSDSRAAVKVGSGVVTAHSLHLARSIVRREWPARQRMQRCRAESCRVSSWLHCVMPRATCSGVISE